MNSFASTGLVQNLTRCWQPATLWLLSTTTEIHGGCFAGFCWKFISLALRRFPTLSFSITPAWIFVSEKFFSGLEFLLFWCNVSGSQRTWNGEHEWSLCAATMQIIYRKMRNFRFNRWMDKTARARRTKYSVHRMKLLAIYVVPGTKSLKST